MQRLALYASLRLPNLHPLQRPQPPTLRTNGIRPDLTGRDYKFPVFISARHTILHQRSKAHVYI